MIEAVAIRKGKITMLRSLYSGISGMKSFQTKLDVIGNNIANVNTFGFKKGRVTFSDQMSQTMSGATTSAADGEVGRGGKNAKQVGLGAAVASIDTISTQGSSQNTGRPLDFMIEGTGYFILRDDVSDPDTATTYYSRSGNFFLDTDGNIVNGDGLYLVDSEGAAINIPADSQSYSIGSNGKISIVDSEGVLNADKQFKLAIFSNPDGLQKVGTNLFQPSNNSGRPADGEVFGEYDAEAGYGAMDPETGAGSIKSSSLEMSNVDLAEEFAEMIVAQRAFQSNTKIITTSDEVLQELMGLKR